MRLHAAALPVPVPLHCLPLSVHENQGIQLLYCCTIGSSFARSTRGGSITGYIMFDAIAVVR